ncbi:dTDP-4-dehydrorhamnose reductase family protein [Devosia sp. Root635]|uniref:dTDP-4-dehydrorhamnose reductase family protein n=1 Tax=Devosia sp. Root635 TaxID=1736575 RepID=UPI0006FDF8C0|nr:SDR family oxidoreductase [Devosia sp. Root635]KRA55360.1 NAD(P)-dependent oxidoreductase [Devosia sp. Root635]
MTSGQTTVLVIGATGMLGNAMLRLFAQSDGYLTYGSTRALQPRPIPGAAAARLVGGVDAENVDSLVEVLASTQPDIVINCVGVVKQLSAADDPLVALPLNSVLPHRLARLTGLVGARLVHISTDCVFSGNKGNYRELDIPDAGDLYGRSKLLGEVDYPHAITLRTSIIGHELSGARSLVDWFLSQQGTANGYRKAIFSGVPTIELARIVRDHVLPNPGLHGTYHVSAAPVDKYSLLQLVADVYDKAIDIVPSDAVEIDRSLNSERFAQSTGYRAPDWPTLIRYMHEDKLACEA